VKSVPQKSRGVNLDYSRNPRKGGTRRWAAKTKHKRKNPKKNAKAKCEKAMRDSDFNLERRELRDWGGRTLRARNVPWGSGTIAAKKVRTQANRER